MKPLGKTYDEAEAAGGDFQRIPAGGYVCKMLEVKDVPEKEYLAVLFDIVEGEYKGFYADDWGKAHPFAHTYYISYREAFLGRFKGNMKAIDESNGTNFAAEAVKGLNEQKLVGKLIGLLIGYEEYETDRGEIRQGAKARAACSVEKIRSGNYKVPELRKLKPKLEDPREGFTPVDEDLPF